jgi:hypothetical protein
VDRAIDSSSAQQRCIRGIDDRIDAFPGDVTHHQIDVSVRNHHRACLTSCVRCRMLRCLVSNDSSPAWQTGPVVHIILIEGNNGLEREGRDVFDTKIAIVLRNDLEQWQALNVTAFLVSGIVSQAPEIIGQPYIDGAGNGYNSMSVQPVVVLSADAAAISRIHLRAIARGIQCSLYVEEMFATGHDEANRAVFREYTPETASVVGIALRADRRIVDKITKGAHMHP